MDIIKTVPPTRGESLLIYDSMQLRQFCDRYVEIEAALQLHTGLILKSLFRTTTAVPQVEPHQREKTELRAQQALLSRKQRRGRRAPSTREE